MPSVPLDPVYQALVDSQGGMKSSMASIPINDLRKFFDQYPRLPSEVADQVAVEEIVAPTTADNGTGTVNLTLVRPKGSEHESLPVAIYIHGSGWIRSNRFTSEKFMFDLVVEAHIAVIYVEFSLSPEIRYPVAIEECYSSILWVHENAASLNLDPKKLILLGDSSGGNMAAVEAILLKQRGHGDVVSAQILIYPATAHSNAHHQYESFRDYIAVDYTLSLDDMDYVESLYYGGKYKKQLPNGRWSYSPEHVTVAPLLATDDELKGLPRCLTITAECDMVRDEGEQYARRLTHLGVESTTVRFIGAIHGYMTIPVADAPQYRRTLQLMRDFIKE